MKCIHCSDNFMSLPAVNMHIQRKHKGMAPALKSDYTKAELVRDDPKKKPKPRKKMISKINHCCSCGFGIKGHGFTCHYCPSCGFDLQKLLAIEDML